MSSYSLVYLRFAQSRPRRTAVGLSGPSMRIATWRSFMLEMSVPEVGYQPSQFQPQIAILPPSVCMCRAERPWCLISGAIAGDRVSGSLGQDQPLARAGSPATHTVRSRAMGASSAGVAASGALAAWAVAGGVAGGAAGSAAGTGGDCGSGAGGGE